MTVHTFNPRTLVVKAGESLSSGEPGLHCEFEATQVYIMRHYLSNLLHILWKFTRIPTMGVLELCKILSTLGGKIN